MRSTRLQPQTTKCSPINARASFHLRIRKAFSDKVSQFARIIAKLPRTGRPLDLSQTVERTALLVDDDYIVRQVAQQGLRRAGWNVVAADSAWDALEFLTKMRFDVMISDIAMRGMDGIELTRRAVKLQPYLPVVLTSGYENKIVNGNHLAVRIAFLEKPYLNSTLLEILMRLNEEEPSTAKH